ncbi:MAG: sialate O-acetylesterase, partial [Bacteroidales bacterium]
MKQFYILLLSLLSFSLTLSAQHKDFILPSILSDHAVLQRNSEVKLWGWCPSIWNLKIVCSWMPTDTIRTQADKNCAWSVYVNTPDAGGPHSIRFYGWQGRLEAEINDILMGESWLCSGQSNMEYNFNWRVSDAGDIGTMLANREVRFFKVPVGFSTQPLEKIGGKWEVCTPESYKDFSVVGFFFGQRLHGELNVPVGLIGSYWGGTAVQPWTPASTYALEPALEEKANRLPASWA